jgi:hypothetical protein
MFAEHQSAMPRSAALPITKGQVHMILAIESRYAPYFKKVICETDFLTRLKPMMDTANAMAVMVMTKETQQRKHAELAELWRGIEMGLPPKYRPSFSALEFSSAIRDGQMDQKRLAQDIANHVGGVCAERLADVSSNAADRVRWLERQLQVVFEQLLHQAEQEQQAAMIQEHTRKLLQRFYRLPDLFAAARTAKPDNIYAEQDALAKRYDELKKPYRLYLPYRTPAKPCKSGEHNTAMARHTLVDPARKQKVELWEADIHEALAHGAALPFNAAEFLERLNDADLPAPTSRDDSPLALTLAVTHDPQRGVQLAVTAMNHGNVLAKLCLDNPSVRLFTGAIVVELTCGDEHGNSEYLVPRSERTKILWLEFGKTLPVLDRGDYEISLSVRSDVEGLHARTAQHFVVAQTGTGVSVQQVLERARVWLRAKQTVITFEGEQPPIDSGDKRTRVSLSDWSLSSGAVSWELEFSNKGPEMFGSTSVSVSKQGEAVNGTLRRILE